MLLEFESSAILGHIGYNQFCCILNGCVIVIVIVSCCLSSCLIMSLLRTWSLLTQKIKYVKPKRIIGKTSSGAKLSQGRMIQQLLARIVDCESLINIWKSLFFFFSFLVFNKQCFQENIIDFIIFPPCCLTWDHDREGTQSCPSTENWLKDLLSMAPPIRTSPSFPHSQSLWSGSFHKPLILIHQVADRMKTRITEN